MARRYALSASQPEARPADAPSLSALFATHPRNRLLSPFLATLPKTPFRKPFVCHTCDPLPFTPSGGEGPSSLLRFLCSSLRTLPLTPLECAVTRSRALSSLECAVTKTRPRKCFRMRSYEKRWGEGGTSSDFPISNFRLCGGSGRATSSSGSQTRRGTFAGCRGAC